MRTTFRPNKASNTLKTLHIAIDFGTTFSAAAYAVDHGNGKPFNTGSITEVRSYPDGDARGERDVKEVPTELLCKAGQKQPVAWGWEARSMLSGSREAYKLRAFHAARFKLLLTDKVSARHIRKDLEERILRDGRTPIDLVVDFLTPLREHVLKEIQRSEDDEEEFKTWKHQWTLTVPADWSPRARRLMLEAAAKAGFTGKVRLISEPEAAALHILETRAEKGSKLTLEDAVVVGDLGGGTIDCATYLISGLEPLSLSALAAVKGRICGSSNLNDNFRHHMRIRLENQTGLEQDSGRSMDQILDDVVDWFEGSKRRYSGPKQHSKMAPVPYCKEDLANRIYPAEAEISGDDFREIFEPVVAVIIALLREQVRDSVLHRSKTFSRSKFRIEKIFLTGGLAACSYIQDRVMEAFEEKHIVNYPIPVVTPSSPETAVVRGAVWRSLCPEKITQRISETSYGFRRDESYYEGWTHGGPRPVVNELTGALEMKDRMKWVVKQGEVFKNEDRRTYRLERYVPVGGSLEFEETMYYSDTVKDDSVYYESPGIEFFGVLEFNLEKWRKAFDVLDGRYMMIEYDLVSTISEDTWSYEIQMDKKKTVFKGSGDITAGFKLSQGYIEG